MRRKRRLRLRILKERIRSPLLRQQKVAAMCQWDTRQHFTPWRTHTPTLQEELLELLGHLCLTRV